MINGQKYNWQIRLAATVIFLLGFTAGVLTSNVYSVLFTRKPMDKQAKYEKIFDQLSLTEQQKEEVRKIIAETREEIQALRRENEPKMREIRSRTSEKLQKVLTPEQWEDFQRLRDEAFNDKK
ncbi:MAG: Spy/CpxP family protein refolding chaperone [Pyrinomonadaceae bacterium]|nr:Spy/CpxP family protein refolding chaperone [Pyrinomonadaceae bacterium]MCX7640720.1 Spy/CpxP family protein refolding chaperone [Pyrinomonadaceae bacterium]MDW8305312.1 Spy/CpxP family protein refolding chaperone [Acidobacteriota bacterium]